METMKNFFAKMIEKLKDYLNDRYFGTVECAHCKKQGKAFAFRKTADGARICKPCLEELPATVREKLDEQEFFHVQEVLNFVEYSKKELEPKFVMDLSYHGFCVDTVHGLFRIIAGSPVMEIKDLDVYDFRFEPETLKEGVFSAKVTGDVSVCLLMKRPSVVFDEKIAVMVTGKAKKRFASDVVLYDNPKKLDDFIEKFDEVVARVCAEQEADC